MQHTQGNFDVAALIKQSREQRLEKQANASKSTASTPNPTNTVRVLQKDSDLESAKNGEYVQTEDGTGALVIDHEEQARKMRENDKTGQALLNLIHSPGLISEANEYVPNYGEDAPEGYDPGDVYAAELEEKDPLKAEEFRKLRGFFSEFALGPNGLTDDPVVAEAIDTAMEKLYTGEVVLPTPEEYRAQKAELEKKKKERKERLKNKATNSQQSNQKPEQQRPDNHIQKTPVVESDSELKMAEMPENVTIRKGVVEQMAEMFGNTENKTNTVPIGQNRVSIANPGKSPATKTSGTAVVPESKPEPIKEEEAGVEAYGEEEGGIMIDTPPQQQSAIPEQEAAEEESAPTTLPKQNGVLNLAEMEEEMGEFAEEEQTEGGTPAQAQDPVTVINVEQGKADDVIRQLPYETYDKVVKSKTIQVNEVELKDVPVATRTITNIDEYRALASRRKNKKNNEVTERVLINSGMIVTVKSATSMEMASIFKNTMFNETDWAKMYQFCYEHTVTTSIGKLGYNDYVSKVSPSDIETVLDGIYEISETDERTVELNCGKNDGGCGNTYTAKFEPKTLPNINRLPEKSIARIKEIVNARNDIVRAKEIQKNSPTCIVKCAKLDDRIIHIRSTTGHMMIERIEQVDNIANRYNSLIALLILYVEKISITLPAVREDVEPESFDIVEVEALCEELKSLEDDELEQIKYLVSEGLDDYETVSYSLKGNFVCSHCQMVKTEVPCNISDLVFQKVQRMLE